MKLWLPQVHVDMNISRRDLTSLAEHHSEGNLKTNTKALGSLQKREIDLNAIAAHVNLSVHVF